MKKDSRINICLLCTVGGHFEQMTNLSDFYNCYNHFWITNRNKQTEEFNKNERIYFIKGAHYKRPWEYIGQIIPILKIFRKENPTHILCTGSGRMGLIPFIFSRFMKIKFIYIDTFSRVNGRSKFGEFLLKIGHQIFTQWNDQHIKNAIYIGPIIKKPINSNKKGEQGYIFVTVGTRKEPFLRLIKGVEELAKKGVIKEKVIIQAGHTNYQSNNIEIFDFCPPEKIEDLIINARYVVTQESAGIGTLCLKYNTRFIVMPREYRYGELLAKSDMKEDLHFKLEEMGYTKVVRNIDELENAIQNIDKLKVGYNFDNTYAIQILKKLIETHKP
jgi:UDP-N-acetylglucosamine transferase subunit ALG13